MKKIIINSKFTSHQKLMLFLFFIFTFGIGVLYLLGLIPSEEMNTKRSDYIAIAFLPISVYIFALFFSKQGVVIKERKLKYSQFIFGFPFLMKNIELTNITDVSVLSSSGAQKFAFVSAGNPDLAVSSEIYKIVLLNENHSSKFLLMITRKKDLAEKMANGLSKELHLEYNIYSPPIVRRRRR
ncbi:hypothetical protein SAMN04487765_3723 [Tenacibaculum sp. MAR_2010_89]|uniref:hypothetical protein n=1 Tax=Tenacibaculum sp. MAR_2010_89 TaxID=1250198 RepID=UPI0008965986|nr:hypothetical protein [Tenacibaculum sp. MAR_2010_89]SEE67180.1 hypothetical protein SAMN04487765_3723 [Tenacibaculum sp. MAR_2010_89]